MRRDHMGKDIGEWETILDMPATNSRLNAVESSKSYKQKQLKNLQLNPTYSTIKV